MRLAAITISILLFSLSCPAQDDHAQGTPLARIQQIKNDTLRMDSLYTHTQECMDTNVKEALATAKILLDDAKQHGYQKGIANATYALAGAYEYVPDYPKSLQYYLAALPIQKELNLYAQQINSLLGISRIYDALGDLPNQKKYVSAAVALAAQYKTEPKVKRKQSLILDYLATIYKIEGRYDTAIKVYKEAIELAKKDNDAEREMGSLCNMAIALKSDKEYGASLAAYKEALALLDTAQQAEGYAIIMDNMAILFYNMGDYAQSEAYSLKALEAAKRIDLWRAYGDIYNNLKNTYIKQKRYPEALEYYEKLANIRDTLFNREKSQQISELQAKYDSDTKDKQIAIQKAKISFDKKVTAFLVVISALLLLMGALIYWNQRRVLQRNRIIEAEKKRSEELLRNILPEETASELMAKGFATSHKYDQVTVMFIDFVGFTLIAEGMKAEDLVGRIDQYFSAFDTIVLKYGLEKIKTIGDSYMCAGGLPIVNTTNHIDVVHAAIDILKYIESDESGHIFKVRIGVHSGPLVAGVVGKHKFQYDIWGDTVNVAARIEEHSEPGRINISGHTYELVKGTFNCEYRGKIKAKNKGELDMYFVNSAFALSEN